MKKKLLIVLFGLTISLTGCGGQTVAMADYDAKTKELEDLQEKYDSNVAELENLQKNYDEKVTELENTKTKLKESQDELKVEKSELAKVTQELDSLKEPSTESEIETSDSKNDAEEQNEESLNFFNDVYVPYANREKPFLFEAVKKYAESCNYETSIDAGNADTNASIKFSASNGDCVNFIFSPINEIDMIMLITFHHASSNSEVTFSNYSSDGAAKYDIFKTQIIGNESKQVDGIDEQREFLFS